MSLDDTILIFQFNLIITSITLYVFAKAIDAWFELYYSLKNTRRWNESVESKRDDLV